MLRNQSLRGTSSRTPSPLKAAASKQRNNNEDNYFDDVDFDTGGRLVAGPVPERGPVKNRTTKTTVPSTLPNNNLRSNKEAAAFAGSLRDFPEEEVAMRYRSSAGANGGAAAAAGGVAGGSRGAVGGGRERVGGGGGGGGGGGERGLAAPTAAQRLARQQPQDRYHGSDEDDEYYAEMGPDTIPSASTLRQAHVMRGVGRSQHHLHPSHPNHQDQEDAGHQDHAQYHEEDIRELRAGRLDMVDQLSPGGGVGRVRAGLGAASAAAAASASATTSGPGRSAGGGPSFTKSAAGYFVPVPGWPSPAAGAPAASMQQQQQQQQRERRRSPDPQRAVEDDNGGQGRAGPSKGLELYGVPEDIADTVRDILGGVPSTDNPRKKTGYVFGSRPPATQQQQQQARSDSFAAAAGAAPPSSAAPSRRSAPAGGSVKNAVAAGDDENNLDVAEEDGDDGSASAAGGSVPASVRGHPPGSARESIAGSSIGRAGPQNSRPQSHAMGSSPASTIGGGSGRGSVALSSPPPRFLSIDQADPESAPADLAETLHTLIDRLAAYRDRVGAELKKRREIEARTFELAAELRAVRREGIARDLAERELAESAAARAIGSHKLARANGLDGVMGGRLGAHPAGFEEQLMTVKLNAGKSVDAARLTRAARAAQHRKEVADEKHRRSLMRKLGFIAVTGGKLVNKGSKGGVNEDGGEGEGEGDDFTLPPLDRAKRYADRRWSALSPFIAIIDNVDSKFGEAVAAYFHFFAWVLGVFALLSFFSVCFGLQHILTGSAVKPSEVVGTIFPQVILPSSYAKNEGNDLLGHLLLVFFVLLLLAVSRYLSASGSAKVKEAMASIDGEARYSKLVFGAIDFRVRSRAGALESRAALGERLSMLMHEDVVLETAGGRSWRERGILLARRSGGMILSFGAIVWLLYVIAQVIFASKEIQLALMLSPNGAAVSSVNVLLAPLVPFMVPLAVALINSFLPTLVVAISTMEAWDSHGAYMMALSMRLYAAQTASILVQVLSFMQLADPHLLKAPLPAVATWLPSTATTDNVALAVQARVFTSQPFLPGIYACRLDAAAAGLIEVMLAQFVATKILGLLAPFASMIRHRIIVSCCPRCCTRTVRGGSIGIAAQKAGSVVPIDAEGQEAGSSLGSASGGPVSSPADTSTNTAAEQGVLSGSFRPSGQSMAKPSERSKANVPGALSGPSAPSAPAPPSPLHRRGTFLSFFFAPFPKLRVVFWPEHNGAVASARLLYFVYAALFSFIFSPICIILAFILLFLEFHWESWYLHTFQRPPRRPWDARKAAPVFAGLFLFTVVVAAIANAVMLSNTTFVKTCGEVSRASTREAFGGVKWLRGGDSDPYCVSASDIAPAYGGLHGWKRGMSKWEIESPYNQAALEMPVTGTLAEQRRRLLTSIVGEEVGYWLDHSCAAQCNAARLSMVAGGGSLPTDVAAEATWCQTRCSTASDIIIGCGMSSGWGSPTFFPSWEYLGASGLNQGWTPIIVKPDSEAYKHPSVFVAANITTPCQFACGALVDVASGMAAFTSWVRGAGGLALLIFEAAHTPMALWMLCILAASWACIAGNSSDVNKVVAAEREAALKVDVSVLNAEARRNALVAKGRGRWRAKGKEATEHAHA